MAGVRALVSAGWGGLGDTTPPDNVFILKGKCTGRGRDEALTHLFTGNIPHDWLFAEGRVAAVCHHGGELPDVLFNIVDGTNQVPEPQLSVCVMVSRRL